MKIQPIKTLTVVIISFLFVELFKIIFHTGIEKYFFNNNTESDAMTFTILSIREIPFLIIFLTLILLRKRMKLNWSTLVLGVIIGYILNRMIW